MILSAFNALDAQPRAGRAAAEAEEGEQRAAREILRLVQPDVRHGRRTATSGCPARCSERARSRSFFWLACGVAGYLISNKLPTSFVPDEDQGYFYLNVQLPNAASLQRTERSSREGRKICWRRRPASSTPPASRASACSACVRTSYNAFAFVSMKEWGRPEDARRAVPGDQGAPEPGTQQASGRRGFQLLAAGDSRRRHLGRVHLHSGGPVRRATSSSCRTT